MLHRTKDGDCIHIEDMKNSHLLNTIKALRRAASKGITVRVGGGTTADDIWYDEDHLEGEEALEHMNFYKYVEEARRRGLNNKEVMA